MKEIDFSNYIHARFEYLKMLHAAKNAEYAGEDVLAAFKKAQGISLHDDPKKILWEYMAKHMQSIKDYCAGDKPNIKLTEKTGDVILYLMLLEAAWASEINIDNTPRNCNPFDTLEQCTD